MATHCKGRKGRFLAFSRDTRPATLPAPVPKYSPKTFSPPRPYLALSGCGAQLPDTVHRFGLLVGGTDHPGRVFSPDGVG
jgi:hypothetical protein